MSDIAKRLDVLYELKRYEELLHVSIPLCASHDEEGMSAYHYTILTLIALERLEEALQAIAKALEQFPLEVHFLYFHAFVLFKQDRLKEALSCVKELLFHEPNHGAYHHLHAQILVELSRYVEAKRAIDKALALDAHNADFLLTLAIITYDLGNTPIACEIVTAILASDPHHAGALHLHSTLGTSNLFEKSNVLRKILFRNPFDVEGKERLESIKRYYALAPALMFAFLLYALGEHFDMWEKSPHTSGVLLLLSLYVWRDWRLSLPFFVLCFALLGNVTWHEWYVTLLGAAMYYVMGRIGGQILGLIFAKIKEIFQKGKRWMNR